jgi:glutathione gamma-glutamylcysteinyltransferase
LAQQSASSSSHVPTQPRDAGLLLFGESAGSRKKKDQVKVSLSLSGQFYQRSLPAAQVTFSSTEGRRLFREALADGHMENYFFLAEQFRTQDEPTFCGLTTLAMVLNSLRIDPMQTWKGAWRWISEDMLGCCTTPDQVREEGLSYDMFRSLAICQGARVDSNRAPAETQDATSIRTRDDEALASFIDSFREAVRRISKSKERECLVICYSRERLGQTGAGHFSPIGGFHEGSDSVLIMDVARFKYPPHWATVQDVVEAMTLVDPDTGRPRGFLELRLADDLAGPQERSLRPLYIPFVPAAAGRRLAEALTTALASSCPALAAEPTSTVAMRRWLHAASTVEPQVLKRLLQVGDVSALREVSMRLSALPLYDELCNAYASLVSSGGGFKGDFPPLRFRADDLHDLRADGRLSEPTSTDQEELPGLATHGELWIMLLLLLPQHLRAAVSEELGCALIPHSIATTVRGPWALPLEALREALGHTLPAANSKNPCQPE